MIKIGILQEEQKDGIKKALQNEIRRLGADAKLVPVEDESDFASINALVLPRGKSLVYSGLLGNTSLGRAVARFSKNKPVLAICGSLIACARLGKGCVGRKTIRIVDAKVDNGQINGDFKVLLKNGRRCTGNFTHAPILCALGKNVEKIAEAQGNIVAVRDRNAFGFCYFDKTGKSYAPFIMAALESH